MQVAATNLGGRVEINSVEIKENEIRVDMVMQGPDDPICCPTQRLVKTYALQGEQLMETSSQVVGGQARAEVDIDGIVWNWQGFSDQSEQNDIVTKAKMKSAYAALGVCGFHLGISVGGKHDRINCSGI